jgi:hypothetical protein
LFLSLSLFSFLSSLPSLTVFALLCVSFRFSFSYKLHFSLLSFSSGGLFISSAITVLHQGAMLARSDGLGKGSTLSVLLPLYTPPPPDPLFCDLEQGLGSQISHGPPSDVRRVYPTRTCNSSTDSLNALSAEVEWYGPRNRSSSSTPRVENHQLVATPCVSTSDAAEAWFKGKRVLVVDDGE